VYEIGCLRALEDLTNRSMLDLDLYVGVSGGAFVSSLLAAGVSPAEMYDAVVHPRGGPFGDPAAAIFRLGLGEFWRRTLRAPRVLADALLTAVRGEGRSLADAAWSLFEILPAGLLDNSGVGDYVREVLDTRGVGDRFQDLPHALRVIAVDLDSSDAVAFGADGHRDVPVSIAVQASTALPGLYRPVRIGDRDYVDGGVKKTAHINLAIQNGAGLVFCINPLVPIHNPPDGPLHGHLSNKGVTYVLDQVLRIALHGRMQYGLERYKREHPDVDILLLEPTRDDLRMFRYNIMRYSARRIVAVHGYRSVLAAFRERRSEYRKLLARHGIRMNDPDTLPDEPGPSPVRTTTGRALSGHLDVLRSRLRAVGE
jgi:predicted acylesterase/phospholipase RssA